MNFGSQIDGARPAAPVATQQESNKTRTSGSHRPRLPSQQAAYWTQTLLLSGTTSSCDYSEMAVYLSMDSAAEGGRTGTDSLPEPAPGRRQSAVKSASAVGKDGLLEPGPGQTSVGCKVCLCSRDGQFAGAGTGQTSVGCKVCLCSREGRSAGARPRADVSRL